MPTTKKVPELKCLCLENVTIHIVKHGRMLQKNRDDKCICNRYNSFKYNYTNEILSILFRIYCQDKPYEDEEFRNFIRYLFSVDAPQDVANWPCLEFFFNKYTTRALPQQDMQLLFRLPNNAIPYVVSQCEDLMIFNERFCSFGGERFVQRLHEFRNLVEIDLGRIDGPQILERIFEMCLSIKVLSAYIRECKEDQADAFLFSLCRHSQRRDTYVSCPENGACSMAGKKLRSLRVQMCGDTGHGIACALEHLPVLKDFGKPPTYDMHFFTRNCPDVVKGISILHKATLSKRKSPICLQLTGIFINKLQTASSLRWVSISCSKLDTIQLNTSAFNSALLRLCLFHKIKKLYFSGAMERPLVSPFLRLLLPLYRRIEALGFIYPSTPVRLEYIHDLLEMHCNLKELTFWRFLVSDHSYSPQNFPSSFNKLEKLGVNVIAGSTNSSRQYFRRLLCTATNIKSLDICSPLAEQEFSEAVEINNFNSLEYLCIRGADTRKVPLRMLLVPSNNLKKLEFRDRKCPKSCVMELREDVRKLNYDVEVEDTPEYYRYGEEKDTFFTR